MGRNMRAARRRKARGRYTQRMPSDGERDTPAPAPHEPDTVEPAREDAGSPLPADRLAVPWPPTAAARELAPGEQPLIGAPAMTLSSDAAALEEEIAAPAWMPEETEEERKEGGIQYRKIVREVVETALLALLVFLAVRAGLQNFRVEGLSMYPTLDNGDHILVNKLAYAEIDMERLADFVPFVNAEAGEKRGVFGGPARGDIIVFESPANAADDLIKRVIGLPGERVEILNGRVYINGRLLEEPYITEPWGDSRPEIVIPARHYYVMGDNRNSSQDSRSGRIGLIPRERIVGKALLTYWPLDTFGLAPNGGAEISATHERPALTSTRIDGAREAEAGP